MPPRTGQLAEKTAWSCCAKRSLPIPALPGPAHTSSGPVKPDSHRKASLPAKRWQPDERYSALSIATQIYTIMSLVCQELNRDASRSLP